MKRTYEIDGRDFSTLEEFAEVFSRVVLTEYDWKGNLDAFNDILRGGFGTPQGGFVLRWSNSDLSRERLGYLETIRRLEKRLGTCHPSNVELVAQDLAEAVEGRGPTVFDWLVEIIRTHGVGGVESEDGVELILA